MPRPLIPSAAAARIREGLDNGEPREEIARAAGVSMSTVWRFETARHPLSKNWATRRRYRAVGRVSKEHSDGTVTIRVRRSFLERILSHADVLLPGGIPPEGPHAESA